MSTKKSLYIGGLADEVKSETLMALCIPFGPVKGVDLPMDYKSGRNKVSARRGDTGCAIIVAVVVVVVVVVAVVAVVVVVVVWLLAFALPTAQHLIIFIASGLRIRHI